MKKLMVLAVALLISAFTFSQDNDIFRMDLVSRYVITEEPWGKDTSYFSQQFVIDFREMAYLHIAKGDRETVTSLYDISDYHYSKTNDGYLYIIRNQFGESDQMVISLSNKGNFTMRVGVHTTSGIYVLNSDN